MRACDRAWHAPRGSQTAYSDGFPLLLIGEPSLAELNSARGGAARAARARAAAMNRFRPNLVVAGGELAPFAEDGWGALALGGGRVALRRQAVRARCKIPTIDQETATPDAGSAAPTTDGDDEGGGPAAAAEPDRDAQDLSHGRRARARGQELGHLPQAARRRLLRRERHLHASSAGGRIACGDVIDGDAARAPPRALLNSP